MKILQICHRVPYPPIDGGNIAMLNMAKSLSIAGAEVHLFALNTLKHHLDPEKFPADLRKSLHFQCADIDTSIKISGALKNLFTNESYNVVRFYSNAVANKLKDLLIRENFDLVQLETLFPTPYIETIKKHSTAKICLRAHNAEHIIWERLAASEKNFPRKIYLKFLSKRLKRYELEVLNKIDFLVPITPVDEAVFRTLGYTKRLCCQPLGVDLEEYPFVQNTNQELSLFHLGSMDWLPNVEGVEWFLKECWPAIHTQFPGLKLNLAGRNFPEHIVNAHHPNVDCVGRIEDANAYMSDKQIMIVPLLSGSGMRVKIIQGMALGKTIISTTIGAEGIQVSPGKNILIADTPQEFLRAVDHCLKNPEQCFQIGKAARELVEESYSNVSIGKKLLKFFQS